MTELPTVGRRGTVDPNNYVSHCKICRRGIYKPPPALRGNPEPPWRAGRPTRWDSSTTRSAHDRAPIAANQPSQLR